MTGGSHMYYAKVTRRQRARGMALILSLIFVVLFASMGFTMLTLSSRNVKAADNYRDGNRALENAYRVWRL